MCAQWHGLDDYETMRRDPGPVPYLQEALTIATFEPGIYDVVDSFAPWRRSRTAGGVLVERTVAGGSVCRASCPGTVRTQCDGDLGRAQGGLSVHASRTKTLPIGDAHMRMDVMIVGSHRIRRPETPEYGVWIVPVLPPDRLAVDDAGALGAQSTADLERLGGGGIHRGLRLRPRRGAFAGPQPRESGP